MYTASEKLAIIRLVEESELSIRRTLREIKISRSSFYRWYRAYEQDGLDGLENTSRACYQTMAPAISAANSRHGSMSETSNILVERLITR